MVERIMTMNNKHLTELTWRNLCTESSWWFYPVIFETDCADTKIICLYEIEEELKNKAPDLYDCMTYAEENGCDYIRFHEYGEKIGALPIYDWNDEKSPKFLSDFITNQYAIISTNYGAWDTDVTYDEDEYIIHEKRKTTLGAIKSATSMGVLEDTVMKIIERNYIGEEEIEDEAEIDIYELVVANTGEEIEVYVPNWWQ